MWDKIYLEAKWRQGNHSSQTLREQVSFSLSVLLAFKNGCMVIA